MEKVPMALDKFTQNDIDWVKNEHLAGRSISEISIDTGQSVQMVKRMLAEAGVIQLSWYKTKQEILMLNHLNALGITTYNQLCNYTKGTL